MVLWMYINLSSNVLSIGYTIVTKENKMKFKVYKNEEIGIVKLFCIYITLAFYVIYDRKDALSIPNHIKFGQYVKEEEDFRIISGRDYVQAEDGTPIDKDLYTKQCHSKRFEKKHNIKL